jgi:hypothetical protein
MKYERIDISVNISLVVTSPLCKSKLTVGQYSQNTTKYSGVCIKQTTDSRHWIYTMHTKKNSSQTKSTITKLKDNGPKEPYMADTHTTSANNK